MLKNGVISVFIQALFFLNHNVTNRGAHDFLAVLGINYQYNLSHGFSVFVNYTFIQSYFPRGLSTGPYTFYGPDNLLNWREEMRKRGGYYDPNGHLFGRKNYRFFDLVGNYSYFINKKQKISGRLGLSYAYGQNEYDTLLIYAPGWPDGMGDLIDEKSFDRWEGYWGLICGLSYDYYLWKGRINIGVDANFRYYEKSMSFFVNYGPHIGYSF